MCQRFSKIRRMQCLSLGKIIHPAQIGATVRCGQAVYRRGKNTVAASGKGKVISILLIILSILCPFFALTALEAAVPDVPSSFALGEAVNRMWIFYLFLPIPTASIIFGFYQNKKGIRNVRNIVVGLILAVILAVYGSFTPIFKRFVHIRQSCRRKICCGDKYRASKSEKMRNQQAVRG